MLLLTASGVRRALPGSWEAAGEDAWELLRDLCRWPPGPGKLRAMRRLLGLSKRDFRRLDTDTIITLDAGLPWLALGPIEQAIRPQLRRGLRRWQMPARAGEDLNAMEYALADEYFMEAMNAENPGPAAARLTALLLRPLYKGKRRAVNDRDEIDAAAKKLAKVGPEWAAQSIMYWAGVKKFVFDTYGPWLFTPPPEEGDEEEEQPKNQGPELGWWGRYMDIAESGTFGPLDAVHKTGFHTLCIWLIKKEEAARAQTRELEKMRAKTRT